MTAWADSFGLSAKARQHLDQAYAYEDEGRLEDALRECELAIQLAPDWPAPDWAEAHNYRGVVLEELGCQEKAIEAYQEAVRLDPAFREARKNLLEAQAQFQGESAEPSTDRDVSPSALDKARQNLARAYAEEARGRFDTALGECELAIESAPSWAEPHNLRGIVLEELGRGEEALSAYQEAVRLDPGFQEARENLRELEAELGPERRLSIAGREFSLLIGERIVAQTLAWASSFDLPAQARQHFERACTHEVKGEFEDAMREYESVIRHAPSWANAHNFQGIMLERLGRREEAIAAYREAVRLDPAFRKARENLVEAEAELVQRKEALTAEAAQPATQSKGFHRRAGAYIIDVCIQFAVTVVVGLVASIAFSPVLTAARYLFYDPILQYSLGFYYLSWLMFELSYFAIFEWLFGAAPGKLILGMRVVQEDGRPCTFKAAVVRSLVRLVDQLFLGNVAFFKIARTSLRQRYGDRAAKTVVVDHKNVLIQRLRPWWWFLVAAAIYLGLQGILAVLLFKDALGSSW